MFKRVCEIIFQLVSFIILCTGCYLIWHDYTNHKDIERVTNMLLSDTFIQENINVATGTSTLSINFDNLLQQNPDTVAWLQIPDTSISYPIVQSTNNQFYLSHSFDKTKNKAGWIFADYRNNLHDFNNNIVIYGHNQRNGTMFGSLSTLLSSDWYKTESHHYFYLMTPVQSYTVEIFSVYQIEEEDYYIQTDFSEDSEFVSFLKTLTNRSLYPFNTSPSSSDTIVTLSTCASNNKYRTVVHGKIVDNTYFH